MTYSVPTSVPVCPPLQLSRQSSGHLSFRSRGDGETILFLHGLLGSSKSWAFQFDRLSRDYCVVAWDAPGYGQSDMVSASIEAFVEALREFVTKIGQPKVSLVGHSMGGTVAACFAATFPELVSRLVLSCSHAGYGDPETAPMSAKFERRMREFNEIGHAAYGLNRARDILPDSVPACVFDYAAKIASETNPEGLRRATRMLQRANNRPLLPKLKIPTLILTGEMDTDVHPNLKADLLRLTPATRHVEMPRLGHAPYFEAPDYYSSLIEDFLSGK
ncbi:alpha/beta hydrolase [Bradyrhizobium sp. S69]|uniref:alpha/beta fold hydrolase n=1 Tax=Bradyrhizobium sp. S69 TaxID=1641856 RepID=UPI00131B301F|nr:alpha/beta hydrolase [Bradyrhizobium sp. S69]